jgi:glycosyltransferase involved in cell wall biosynthesis
MRVLVLTQVVVYPADAGPKVKTLQVLRHLAAHHDVHYCTFVRTDQEIEDAGKLNEICRSVSTVPIRRSRVGNARYLLESIVTGDSFLLRRDDRSEMRSTVHKLLLDQRIDVLHVDQLNMMRFVPSNWKGTVILDEHNAVWQVVERLQKGANNPLVRWLLGREVRLIRRQEGNACRRVQLVLAVSAHDQRALREVAGDGVSIEIVPITIDVRYFESFWQVRDPQPNKLFTIGTMFWPPNSEGVMWWLREGYEYLRSICPDVVYDIVGARPPKSLQSLAQSYQGVRMHGYVADVEPFWNHASAMAVPILSGGGVRVKILEAMARGVPVVSTTMGCEGLAVRDQEHLLVADTPQAFALACARLFQENGLAQELVRNARQLLLDHYDANVALSALDKAYTLACK